MLAYYYLRKMNPGIDRSETLHKLRNYSRKEMNHDLYWQAMPTMSPTYKRRDLMNAFGSYDGVDYLTNEPIEDQKAKVAQQL